MRCVKSVKIKCFMSWKNYKYMWNYILCLDPDWNENNSLLTSQYELTRVSLCSLRVSVNIYLETAVLSRGCMTLYLAVAQIHPICCSPTEYGKSLSSLETLLSVLVWQELFFIKLWQKLVISTIFPQTHLLP